MISGKGIDLLVADFCANDKLKVVAKGKCAFDLIIRSFSHYSEREGDGDQIGYDARLNSTKKITRFGYWFRRNVLRYKRVEEGKR